MASPQPPTCQCAERARNLSRLYDERYLAAAEAGEPAVQALAQQVRDDLDALATNCDLTQSTDVTHSDESPNVIDTGDVTHGD